MLKWLKLLIVTELKQGNKTKKKKKCHCKLVGAQKGGRSVAIDWILLLLMYKELNTVCYSQGGKNDWQIRARSERETAIFNII